MQIKCVLICAFLMSFNSYALFDMTDLKEPMHNTVKNYLCGIHGTSEHNALASHPTIAGCLQGAVDAALSNGWELMSLDSAQSPYLKLSMKQHYYTDADGNKSYRYSTKELNLLGEEETDSIECTNAPYIHPVVDSFGKDKCARMYTAEELENDDSCPKTTDVPNLSFSIETGVQTLCFANPNDPASNKSCKYTSDENGMYDLPDLGAQEPVSCGADDTGEPIDPEELPEEPNLDEDNCFDTANGQYCMDDPNDRCEIETGIEGHSSYNCDAGCGKVTMNGQTEFFCTGESDQDGLPSLDCTDPEYASTNPDICAVDNNTDKDGDGITDTKDTVQGLNELKQGQKEGNLKLDEISEGIKELGKKQGEGNKLLKDIKDNTGASTQSLKEIKEQLAQPLEQVTQGQFDISAAQAELQQIKTDYQAKMNSIKVEAVNLIQQLNAGGGSFNSCHDITSMNGKVEQRCLSQFSDEMTPISNGILFFFTVVSGFIVLGGALKND
jgi:hypothetical protein